MGIRAERVQIPTSTGEGSFGGYLARPDDDRTLPSVLVFQEIFGVNVHIREVVERLAAEGYVVLAPDIFHRTAPGLDLDYDAEGMEKGLAERQQLTQDQVLADTEDCLGFLQARADTAGPVGCVGFCIGGHLAYLAATTGRFAATASLYGGGLAAEQGLGGAVAPLSRADELQGRLLFLFGDQDPLIPAADVEAVRAALGAAGANHEVVVYAGASHGFFCDRRESHHPKAASDAFARITRLFAGALGVG